MSTPTPAVMLIVRDLKSELSREEFVRRYRERLPSFREVPGLLQKYYAQDEETGHWCGIYLWDSEESLAAYMDSDLRKSIPAAYELTAPPKLERFDILEQLRGSDSASES